MSGSRDGRANEAQATGSVGWDLARAVVAPEIAVCPDRVAKPLCSWPVYYTTVNLSATLVG